MRSFFKIFLAAFLAMAIFFLFVFFFLMGVAGGALAGTAPRIYKNSVLQIDLANAYPEQPEKNIQSLIKAEGLEPQPGLYDVLRLIDKAKTDENISGIFVVANNNVNGFATSGEIRSALLDFKNSGKFIFAYGDAMTQKAYSVANVAGKIYVSPKGYFEWLGLSVNYYFLKGMLDKLEIKPQIFYAGKFKSATEPFRATEMTPANRQQTSEWINELYSEMLQQTAQQRNADTATLHRLANTGKIETPQDAVSNKLIDGVRYYDEVRAEIKKIIGMDEKSEIHFVPVEKYAIANKISGGTGEKIALIYASGNIVDGKGGAGLIGSDQYISLLRKAREDKSIKAIVMRVNSGGGSALASENIWREMVLAKKEKPLMVSFGDVAASGGYYISCAADSIFASKNSITGSIGVFGVIPDMSTFFKNKLGITFDGVKTGSMANFGTMTAPMTDSEKKLMTSSIERIYSDFKQRVAEGRKRDTAYIESIAQGRVWTGIKAKQMGLVDAFGGLQDAINAAAAKAKLKEVKIVEYPKTGSLLEQILGINKQDVLSEKMKTELGDEFYQAYLQLKQIKQIAHSVQAKLPFDFEIK